MKRQRPRWLAQVRSRPALFTPKGEPVGANPLPPHRTLYLLCLLREKDVQMAHLARLKYLGIGSDRWVTPPPSWEVIENMYAKNSSNCFAQKTNSIKPNRAVRDRKGQRAEGWKTFINTHFKSLFIHIIAYYFAPPIFCSFFFKKRILFFFFLQVFKEIGQFCACQQVSTSNDLLLNYSKI